MNYLLDTNILLIYGRSIEIADKIEAELRLFNGNHNLAISALTLGELDSLAKQFQYGNRRKIEIQKLLEGVFVIDINIQKIIDRYGDVDAFSQGKLKNKESNFSARNMGKNDLWIAATASVYDLKLVTADKDFNHLDGIYLDLIQVELEKFKK
jgi:predicted nucleic acid-binding protein